MAKSLRQAVKIIGAAVSIGQPKKGVEKTPDILKSHNIERLFSKNYEPK